MNSNNRKIEPFTASALSGTTLCTELRIMGVVDNFKDQAVVAVAFIEEGNPTPDLQGEITMKEGDYAAFKKDREHVWKFLQSKAIGVNGPIKYVK